MHSGNFRDLTGQRFENKQLVVLESCGQDRFGHTLWRCRRDDGKEILRTGSYLIKYDPKEKVERPKRLPSPKRPLAPEYNVWASMKQRCLNPNAQAYKDYGGRGITVCKRWQDSYEAFLADVGPRPDKHHSLERESVNGHYEPGNVRWAARVDQARNQRSNRLLTHEGLTLTIAGWAERTGLSRGTIHNRLNMGLSLPEVFQPGRKKQASWGIRRSPKMTGLSHMPEYQIWRGMVARCTQERHPAWNRYGGRGITVCASWLDSFDQFLKDLGLRPSEQHSLERKRVNDSYGPDNCCWATRLEQGRNTRRTRMLTYQGETLCISEWADRLGVKYETIRSRLRMGWDSEQALTF